MERKGKSRVRKCKSSEERRGRKRGSITYNLGTALSGTGGALVVAVVLRGGGHGRGDGGEGGDSGEDGLELHFERVDCGS